MNNKKTIAIGIIILLVGAGAGFYGGTIYQKNKLVQNFSGRGFGDRQGNGEMRGLGQGQRAGMMGGQGQVGGFFDGEIISKDDKSITLKTRDGGSKIIYFSAETKIGKTTEGSMADLNVGQQLMVNGKSNSDGSLTANNIQIRSIQTDIIN